MPTADEIKQAIPIVSYMQRRGATFKKNGGEMFCLCPLHNDHNPSMRVNEHKQLWRCDPCNKGGSIIDLHKFIHNLSLPDAMKDLADMAGLTEQPKQPKVEPRPEAQSPLKGQKNKPDAIIARYDYHDEYGDLLFQVCRTELKKFFQRRPVAGNEWKWGLGETRRVLYHLPDILKAETVVICEGEKDADSMVQLGYCATTCPMGAGKWLDAYTDCLTGKHIILCTDNDEPGREHRDLIIASLEGKVADIAVCRIPDPFKDVTEYTEEFSTVEAAQFALTELIADATILPKGLRIPVQGIEHLEKSMITTLKDTAKGTVDLGRWLPALRQSIRPLRAGELCTIIGDTGTGKSAVLQNICVRLTNIPILFFELELPASLMFERFAAILTGKTTADIETGYLEGKSIKLQQLGHIWTCTKAKLTVDEIADITRKSAQLIGTMPALVIVDYIQLLKGSGSRYERFSNIAEEMKVFAKDSGVVAIQASQVKRREDGRYGIAPGMHDAKESGSIENSSGLILGISMQEDDTSMAVRVLKATSGRPGLIVNCAFDGATLRVTERSATTGINDISSASIEARRAAQAANF